MRNGTSDVVIAVVPVWSVCVLNKYETSEPIYYDGRPNI